MVNQLYGTTSYNMEPLNGSIKVSTGKTVIERLTKKTFFNQPIVILGPFCPILAPKLSL